ncbi:uncharacterized protein LY89DRAFT_741761 [Mollisia scopiformis]|uniref:Uncharacterized protein n=1 Tax=Mollisia scopiformis TaxID=149040 RepID=A0A132B7Q1_MOLSC|nr:uncharacterized protein LY89DRAFT_741761 [Mollisia scopiformis]KUJ08391.1 hypothetical protein LY89DRAFT_741761 [Mollisia scopiformis]
MCVWSSIAYGCGHHGVSHQMCKVKEDARDTGFIHSVQCELIETALEQPRSCPACGGRVEVAVVTPSKQDSHLLEKDSRNTLPSQTGKTLPGAHTQDSKPLPPRLPTLAGILLKKRKIKIWQGTSQATGLEWARRTEQDDLPKDLLPADGRVIGEDGQLWLTAAAHLKQQKRGKVPLFGFGKNHLHERDQPDTLREAYRAGETGQQASSGLRAKPALPLTSKAGQESVSAQEEAELFFNVKEQDKRQNYPSCLVPGGPSDLSQKISYSQLSALYEVASTNTPRETTARNTTEPVPAQGKAAKSSQNNTTSTYKAYDAGKQQAAASVAPTTSVVMINAAKPAADQSKRFAPRLPNSKRISPLHFEGTVLGAFRNFSR